MEVSWSYGKIDSCQPGGKEGVEEREAFLAEAQRCAVT